jgi:hypothetical protein
MNIYTSMPWASLCDEVAKLKVERRTGQVLSMSRSGSGEGGGEEDEPPKPPSAGGLTPPFTSGEAVCGQPLEARAELRMETPGIECSCVTVGEGPRAL